MMDRSSWMVTWCSAWIILSLPEPSNAPDVFQRHVILYYCLNGFTPELQGPDLWFCLWGFPPILHSMFPTTDTYVPYLLQRPLQFCSHSRLLSRLLLRSVLELEQYSQLWNMLPYKFPDPSSRDFYSHISVWAQESALRKHLQALLMDFKKLCFLPLHTLFTLPIMLPAFSTWPNPTHSSSSNKCTSFAKFSPTLHSLELVHGLVSPSWYSDSNGSFNFHSYLCEDLSSHKTRSSFSAEIFIHLLPIMVIPMVGIWEASPNTSYLEWWRHRSWAISMKMVTVNWLSSTL